MEKENKIEIIEEQKLTEPISEIVNEPINNEPINNEPINNGPLNNELLKTGPLQTEPLNNGPIKIEDNKDMFLKLIDELKNEIAQLKLGLNKNDKENEIKELKNEIETLKKAQENSYKEIILLKTEIELLKQAKPVPVNVVQINEEKKPVEEELSEVEKFKKKYNIRENSSEIEI